MLSPIASFSEALCAPCSMKQQRGGGDDADDAGGDAAAHFASQGYAVMEGLLPACLVELLRVDCDKLVRCCCCCANLSPLSALQE